MLETPAFMRGEYVIFMSADICEIEVLGNKCENKGLV